MGVYTSDHGDWLGDHGLVLKGPIHREGLLRVPMLARGPRMPTVNLVDEPASTLDIRPNRVLVVPAWRLQRLFFGAGAEAEAGARAQHWFQMGGKSLVQIPTGVH